MKPKIMRLFFVLVAMTCVVWSADIALAEPPRDRPFTVEWRAAGFHPDLAGIYFVDQQTGWAVGAHGTIVSLRDGGASWSFQTSDTDKDLNAVYFADAHKGWVVGSGGVILATRDGGATWHAQHSGVDAALSEVRFIDAKTGWVVGKNNAALATQDGGATWRPLTETQSGHTYDDLTGLYLADRQTGWVIAAHNSIYIGRDDGVHGNWQREFPRGLYSVRFIDALTGWAVGDGGTILVTRDGGKSWNAQESATSENFSEVRFVDAQHGWVVGRAGSILATEDGGANWEPQKSGTDKSLNYVYFANALTGWVVGGNGTILATLDGGKSWRPQESGAHEELSGVTFVDNQVGWVVGSQGTILATRDGGTSWHVQHRGTGEAFENVHFVDPDFGWAVGDGGVIVVTKDGGATWAAQKSGTNALLVGVYFLDPRTGWVVGDGGTVLATKDGGATWVTQDSGSNALLTEVYFIDASTGWVVGLDGSVLITRDGGTNWKRTLAQEENLARLYFANAKTGWVVGANGTILATHDSAIHWQKQTSGTDSDLADVQFVDTKIGWAVGSDGTILATRDGGASWQKQPSGTKQALSRVQFIDAHTGWAVGDKGTILTTRDGGASWKDLLKLSLWSIAFPDPLDGWVAGRDGTILTTHDGGTSWQTQNTGTHADLVAVHFADKHAGWVAGLNGTILATQDGGASWRPQRSGTDQTLGGECFLSGGVGWVVGGEGTILATQDGGLTWTPQRSGTDAFLNGVYFTDRRTGWVVGANGTILVTQDGGATWTPQKSGTNEQLGRVYFADAHTGWTIAHDRILATHDGGATWEAQQQDGNAGLWDLYFANALTGWVVGEKGTILATRDGGRTWAQEKSGITEDLNGIRFADAHTGWAVGDDGTLLHAGPPVYTPWADDLKVATSAAGLTTELDVSYALHNDDNDPIKTMSFWGKVGRLEWTQLGVPEQLHDGSARWHVVWSPARFGVHPGDSVEYEVRLDDGGPPLAPFDLGGVTYDPWLPRLWQEHQTAVISTLGPMAILLSYASVFGLVMLFAPARLARVGAASALDDVARPSGTFGFVWELARRGFGHVTLPYLCRHPRVRRAWTQRYRAGKARLGELGKSARESFVTEPDVLDAWVEPRIARVMAALERLELFRQRRIYLELPVRVGERQSSAIIERPSPESLGQYFARPRAVVAIVGEGGSGKSTLGCALARWGLAEDPKQRLTEHRMLPVFIVEDTTDLVGSVTRNLRRMLGEEELPDDLVSGLLAKQRLLVIVDALSEREPATQQHVAQVFGEDVRLNAMVITSRTDPEFGPVDSTTLYPLRLDAAHVVPFIIGYLDRLEHVESLKDGRVQLRLGERILALAEAGGRQTPVTPLLVTMFVQSAVERTAEGGSLDDMPDAVPEVFIDYLRRLNSGGSQTAAATPDDVFIEGAQILAVVSLGPNLLPQDFLEQDALEALAKARMSEQAQAVTDRLVASGLIERRHRAGRRILRFSLDPTAEYLAAIRRIFELKGSTQEMWRGYLTDLSQRDGYPDGFAGYLIAFATCHRAYRHDFVLPELYFPWEDEARSDQLRSV